MMVCLQAKSDSSLLNYLQKTDLNSPAFHIINALLASTKCYFIIILFQTTWLQSRKISSFSSVATIKNLGKGTIPFKYNTHHNPLFTARKISPLLWRGITSSNLHNNTRTLCQSSQEQPILVLSKRVEFLNVPQEISEDNKSLRMYCNKKYPRRKYPCVFSFRLLKAF